MNKPEKLFDDPEAILAAAYFTEIRDATSSKPTRSERKEAETERLRALTAEGYTCVVGPVGVTGLKALGVMHDLRANKTLSRKPQARSTLL
jgi:hypothetical protein